MLDPSHSIPENRTFKKKVIYQTLVRYFGNKQKSNVHYGSIEENGCGKFDDITEVVLRELKKFGADYIWYTGVIEHASMTDYRNYGIAMDDPDVVKGRAGSPYAIKDYFDVSPDLAVNIDRRMEEYVALIDRTHEAGMKVIMDFVPNHVARTYKSDRMPDYAVELGASDNVKVTFDAKNDFYYLPNKKFKVPARYEAGGSAFRHPLKDGKFNEFPAKATGNNVFSAAPKIDDWFETIKLNYGVDYTNNEQKYFEPRPPLWEKMFDILSYWAKKGVDGFRCDMVEMVPVEFWNWVITELKRKFPELIFIGEAYDKRLYKSFLTTGKFDFLYDKVGLYDVLKKLTIDAPDANVSQLTEVWKRDTGGFSAGMLHFLENHDEVRIASKAFAGDPWLAVPAMVVTASMTAGPVMVYNGQEVGEPAIGSQGFSGDDGRSSIFDYCNLPQHQKWMNEGAFDGGKLNADEKRLRNFYSKLLNLVTVNEAISSGGFYDLLDANRLSNGFNGKVYAYLRYTSARKVLVLANFNRVDIQLTVKLPADVLTYFNLESRPLQFVDLLSDLVFETADIRRGLPLTMPATSAVILEF